MDKDAVLSVVGRFRRALETHGVKPSKIILFGSHATATAHPGSDIDLVVVSRDFDGKDYWARIDLLVAAIYDVFEPIEAVAMTPEEWESGDSAIADYARRGELVYPT